MALLIPSRVLGEEEAISSSYPSIWKIMNFTRWVFLVGANLVFVGIRYKHLEHKASKASPLCYRTEQSPGCAFRSRR